MNYLITKNKGDTRITTCGLIIPDGWFVVMGLTFKNQNQLKHIMAMPNYDVTETSLPEGNYTPDGYRVDKWSIRDYLVEKTGPLVYIDEAPPEGVDVAIPDRSGIKPPDTSLRPDHIGIDEITAEDNVVLPAGVAKAREIIARQEAAGEEAPNAPTRVETGAAESEEIDQESDEVTLAAAGATDEVAMLRAALDTRGVPYSPQAKAPALRKKLETANAA